ncbi:DUF3817 domain-containing protein [Algibacillus agarilyticus]|uniref:DUF3817 domain-containing protein n=1 Tax=Algibacillus agarilyticus TaxID=2234133 RepID=UPI000DD060E6|nr:DUF3817 domain-containing protein [Algibacillus agarilyticus]
MLNAFRLVSLLEGLSYLLILSVTLGLISRDFVSVLGIGHGVLFMVYLALSLMVSGKKSWPIMGWLALFVASLIPFAFILVEIYLRKLDRKSAMTAQPAGTA